MSRCSPSVSERWWSRASFPAWTLVNRHNDKRAPASISASDDNGSLECLHCGHGSDWAFRGNVFKETIRPSWQDEPQPPVFQLQEQLRVPRGGPSTHRSVNTQDHKTDGLSINLWSALCHTHNYTQTLGRSWVSWYQWPVSGRRPVEDGGVRRLMLFINPVRLNLLLSLNCRFLHLSKLCFLYLVPWWEDFVSCEHYLCSCHRTPCCSQC